MRAPSYFQELQNVAREQVETLIGEAFDQADWKTRLQQWRANQQSKGIIKDFTEVHKEIFESANMTVLAILQTPI